MRQIEGKALDQDIRRKLANMNDQMSSISLLSHEVTTAFENRIRTKLESFKELDEVDEARILSEVAFLADKASIDEEIIRLQVTNLDVVVDGGEDITVIIKECDQGDGFLFYL